MNGFNFNERCEDFLARCKRKNAQVVAARLDTLRHFLRQDGGDIVQTKIGGSVEKGTYVTGLSDVDALLIVDDSSLMNQPPAKVKRHMRDVMKRWLPHNPVRMGDLAVTVGYSDGIEIQLLPAMRTRTGIRLAQPGTTKWSNVVQPERFIREFTEVNTAQKGRVVPVIKLAKAMADCFITRPSRKISGYHMESLAIDAFAGYEGPRDSKTMLVHYLGYAMTAVKQLITDPTGQSRYVDEYLGAAGSLPRERASTYFGQMRSKVNSCETKAAFNALFCIRN